MVKFILKVLSASLIMGIILFILNKYLPVNFSEPFTFKRKLIELLWLVVELGTGITVFFTIAIALKVDEAVYIFNMVAGRAKTVAGKLKRAETNKM